MKQVYTAKDLQEILGVCDRVPRDIWSARVYRVWPVDQDSIAVMIEGDDDERED